MRRRTWCGARGPYGVTCTHHVGRVHMWRSGNNPDDSELRWITW